ncbi:MAG: response regulator [Spirochaetes bacterium]|nr:response regulator [Spirochaetota bacterium]
MNSSEKPDLKVLHLEDDPNDAELIRSCIETADLSFEIITTDNKEEFISILNRGKIDLILADYSLPMFDGLSALRLAKQISPDIPFILVSGTLGEEPAIDSMKAGATDYVLKQHLSRLIPSIKRALQEAEDRNKREKAEEALKESEGKYTSLVDSIDIGVCLVKSDLEIMTFNRQIQKWFPAIVENDNRMIKKCFNIFNEHRATEQCPDCPARSCFLDGKKHECIRKIKIKDEIRNFRIISIPVKNSINEITDLIIMMEDITSTLTIEKEKKLLEERLQQAQKMEAIGTLAGGIAHDLNNILSPIMVYTEMSLMDLPDTNTLKNNLTEIYKASERARDLIKQILTFSRQKHEERKPVTMSIILDEVFKLIRPSLPSTIEISLNIETKSDIVFADPTQIHQILLNLCTNASYAMKEKGGKLEIRLISEYLDAYAVKRLNNLIPGYYVKLIISDTGIGMNDDIQKRIFEPYFTTKSPGEGTGLGLAVIHGIVKSMNGDIQVKSKPGQGSAFYIYLPRINENVLSSSEVHNDLPRGNERILFVDDEITIVNAMKLLLQGLGYKITALTESKECYELINKNPDDFDLVITDMTMPDINGKELAAKILSIRPDIPIILCTGHSDIINKENAGDTGIKAFIMKPLKIQEIAATIREVLRK